MADLQAKAVRLKDIGTLLALGTSAWATLVGGCVQFTAPVTVNNNVSATVNASPSATASTATPAPTTASVTGHVTWSPNFTASASAVLFYGQSVRRGFDPTFSTPMVVPVASDSYRFDGVPLGWYSILFISAPWDKQRYINEYWMSGYVIRSFDNTNGIWQANFISAEVTTDKLGTVMQAPVSAYLVPASYVPPPS